MAKRAKNQGKPHAVPTLHSIAIAHVRSNRLALMLHITFVYRISSSAQTLLDRANQILHEVCERARVCAYEITPHASRITRHASHVTHHTSHTPPCPLGRVERAVQHVQCHLHHGLPADCRAHKADAHVCRVRHTPTSRNVHPLPRRLIHKP